MTQVGSLEAYIVFLAHPLLLVVWHDTCKEALTVAAAAALLAFLLLAAGVIVAGTQQITAGVAHGRNALSER